MLTSIRYGKIMHCRALILKMQKLEHCAADVEFGLCGGLVLVRIRVEKITGFLNLFIYYFLKGL